MCFIVGFLEVIEAFSSIFLCLSLGSVCEGEKFLPTPITVFLAFRDSIAYFELCERTLFKTVSYEVISSAARLSQTYCS